MKKTPDQLKVEYRPLAAVKPNPKNARTHQPKQIDKIIASMKAVGWTKPLIVDEKGEILAGHGGTVH